MNSMMKTLSIRSYQYFLCLLVRLLRTQTLGVNESDGEGARCASLAWKFLRYLQSGKRFDQMGIASYQLQSSYWIPL